MSVEKLITKNVVSVNMDDRLTMVRDQFIRKRFHHLLVVDNNNTLIGVISDRDYFKATTPTVDKPSATSKDLATLDKRVHQILSRKPVSIKQSDSLKNAISKFRQFKVSCLPVVNERNQPIGIITWRDIIDWLYTKLF
ncbi:CBS domain-containing protein [Alteromonas oceanisediminis]|uniref:CBS domain-containing protein n=1 Tax=Alteromonas oceanisediminis TaxID=2836180 RepID=UPI001BD9D06B|nr:CBS domain-containing protein [Alteromonas oceanisediminis]MBT0585984.1 CBS domain-containing protein [Alteromonas oceanisediminis]